MLRECLAAISRLDPPPFEVIVAIDGDSSKIREAAGEFGFEVVNLLNAPGVSATRNAGAARAKGQFIAFLDSDVVPKMDFVKMAFSALDSIPGSVAAFGAYDDSPAALGLISRYRNLLHHFTHQNGRRDAQSFWAACGICQAAEFWQVGGFDENYRVPCIEDIALGYKLRRVGHRIALDPSWQIKHLKRWTWRDLVVTDIARRAIPWTLLLLREGRLDNDLSIDTRSRGSALLVMASLASLVCGFFSPWLLAISTGCFGGAIFLNRRFYRLLSRKEGWFLALGAIPLHLFYYFAATVGWISGQAIFLFQRMLRKK
jgi:glycosyltransferase involved in cell wall biosynthesis